MGLRRTSIFAKQSREMIMSTWEIVFTNNFKEDFQDYPAPEASKFHRYLKFLADNPYQGNNNATKIKNDSHSYRGRLGDFRLFYRVVQKTKRVILRRLQRRGKVYGATRGAETVVGPVDRLIRESQGRSSTIKVVENQGSAQTIELEIPKEGQEAGSFQEPTIGNEIPTESEFLVEYEQVFIEEDELFLIQVPVEFHELIMAADDIADLETCELPEQIFNRITSFIKDPGQSEFGNLYSLDPSTGLSVRDNPLSSFMLAPDPLQKSVIEKDLDSGPLLVRGGPGTGKTLIGLQRLKRIIDSRHTETLFDKEWHGTAKPKFAFFSYTNVLVNTSNKLFADISRNRDVDVVFTTVDKAVRQMLGDHFAFLGTPLGNPIDDKNSLHFYLNNLTIKRMLETGDSWHKECASYVKDNFTVDFLAEEIQSVIQGNDLKSKAAYIEFKRIGRKTPIREKARERLWVVYEVFSELCEQQTRFTWEGQRQKLLHLIEKGKVSYEPFSSLVLDEAQDLSIVALRIVSRLVRDTRYFLMLADSGQSIYNKSPIWKDVNKDLRFHKGNSINLAKSYRMSRQISLALQPLRRDADVDPSDPIKKTEGVFNGEKPIWLNQAHGKHSQTTINILKHLIHNEGVNPGQIALILRAWKNPDGADYTIANELLAANIAVDTVDDKTKPISIDGKAVHIINAHSAKGLEFPFVIVPFVSNRTFPYEKSRPRSDELTMLDEWKDEEMRLLYVALSRASVRLWLITESDNPSPYLEFLDPRNWLRTYDR